MELPDLIELQQFRQSEGLAAPHSRCENTRPSPLNRMKAVDSFEARPRVEEPAHQAPATAPESVAVGESVEHSSYVADRMWYIRAVMDLNNPCGTWGVGGAPRVGAKPGDGVTSVDQYRISVPTRLQFGWGKFTIGEAQQEAGIESLALCSHTLRTRRTGGGHGSAHYDWLHSPRFDSRPPELLPGRWEEASEAIQVAQAAIRHQGLLKHEPLLPRPQKWVPTGGWGLCNEKTREPVAQTEGCHDKATASAKSTPHEE